MANKLFCPKCGQELPLDSGFCPYCGAKLERPPASAVPAHARAAHPARSRPSALRKLLRPRVLVPVAAVLAVVTGALLVWRTFIVPPLPATCYYSLAKVETYREDGTLMSTSKYTLSDRGTRIQGTFATYDEEGVIEDVTTTHYDTDDEHGISVGGGDGTKIEVTEEDEFGQPTEYTYTLGGEEATVRVSYHDEAKLEREETRFGYLTLTSEYDEDGWKTSSGAGDIMGLLSSKGTYELERDGQGRVTSYTYVDSEGNDTGKTQVSYDSNGKVSEVVNEDGSYCRYTYRRIDDPAPYVAAENYAHWGL